MEKQVIAKVQLNLWISKEDADWIKEAIAKYPFNVSANEFIRQLVKAKKYYAQNDGKELEPSFFTYLEDKPR